MGRKVLVGVLGLVACANGGEQSQPFGGTLGAGSTSSGSSSGTTEPTPEGSTGDGGTSTGPGATSEVEGTSTGESPTGSESSGGEGASWHRYSRDMVTGVWTQTPLDELWTAPNAPPATGIAAAASLTHFDRLLVVSEDGMLYERAQRVWLTPVPIAERFPAAEGIQVTAIAHLPRPETSREGVLLVETPVAVIYDLLENGGVELQEVRDLTDVDGGAPQGTVANDWALTVSDPSQNGVDPEWLQWFNAYANGQVWKFAALAWTQYSVADNPFFDGSAGEPDPLSVRAAYYDDTFERAHIIAP